MRTACVLLVVSQVWVGCTASYCDGEELGAALAEARSGETIHVGSCTVEGSFQVPAGVVLAGDDPETSVLRGSDPTHPVVELEPGDPPARLEQVRVESPTASAGVYATGPGSVELVQVHITSREGLGALFVGLDALTLDDVSMVGPVPPAEVDDLTDNVFTRVARRAPDFVAELPDSECSTMLPRACTPDERREVDCPDCGTVRQYCNGCGRWVSVMATQGLTLVDVASATLSGVAVEGFGEFGVVARGSGDASLVWERGKIAGNVGAGLFAEGVQVSLEDLTIEHTYSGFRLNPPVAAFVTGETAATVFLSENLEVLDNRGFGLVQVGGTFGVVTDHNGLDARGNDLPAVWAGGTDGFSLFNSTISGNQLAGVVCVASTSVRIQDTVVSGTRTRSARVGGSEMLLGSVTLGDGIQLFETRTDVTLRNVTLENNERVGLSVELGSATPDTDVCGAAADGICFEAVTVRGTGEQRGAIAGNMATEVAPSVFSMQPIDSGRWDEGITREGSAVDDLTFTDPVELSGVIAPLDTPIAGVIAPLD